jgi:hypothetical protein
MRKLGKLALVFALVFGLPKCSCGPTASFGTCQGGAAAGALDPDSTYFVDWIGNSGEVVYELRCNGGAYLITGRTHKGIGSVGTEAAVLRYACPDAGADASVAESDGGSDAGSGAPADAGASPQCKVDSHWSVKGPDGHSIVVREGLLDLAASATNPKDELVQGTVSLTLADGTRLQVTFALYHDEERDVGNPPPRYSGCGGSHTGGGGGGGGD